MFTETIEVEAFGKKVAVSITDDCDSESPRCWDNVGTMVYAHRRYTLGDEEISGNCDSLNEAFVLYVYENLMEVSLSEPYLDPYSHCELNQKGIDRVEKWIEANLIVLPVYLYDHSGITISTSPFSCSWDSGQVGYIFCTKQDARRELNKKSLTSERIERIKEILKSEVGVFDDYLRGDVYKYHVDELGLSCSGFIGDDHGESGLIDSVRDEVTSLIKWRMSVHHKKLKEQIKHRVPLSKRKVFDFLACTVAA